MNVNLWQRGGGREEEKKSTIHRMIINHKSLYQNHILLSCRQSKSPKRKTTKGSPDFVYFVLGIISQYFPNKALRRDRQIDR